MEAAPTVALISLQELGRLVTQGYTDALFTVTLPDRPGAARLIPAASVTVTISLTEVLGLARKAQANVTGRAVSGPVTAKKVRA